MRKLQVPAMTQGQALLVIFAGLLVMAGLSLVLLPSGLPRFFRIWLPGLPVLVSLAVVKASPKKTKGMDE